MTIRILITGNFGFHNIGDEAILSAMIQELRRDHPACQICVVSGDAKRTAQDHQVEAVDWNNIPQILDEVEKSSLILLGGGGIFHDHWYVDPQTILTAGHGGIPYYCEYAMLAEIMKKPLMIFGVGVGPIFAKDDQDLTSFAFGQANAVTVRDIESKMILKDFGLKAEKVQVTADPAHKLVEDTVNAKKILSGLFPQNGLPIVAVCLRNWDLDGDPSTWQKSIAAALDAFHEKNPSNLLFIPFHSLLQSRLTNDLEASKRVRSCMNQKRSVHILDQSFPPETIAGIISQCRLVVGMRLHSIIMAANACVPVIGLVYDPKVKNLMSRLGLDKYGIELRQISTNLLLELLNDAWSKREQIGAILKIKNARLKSLARRNFELVNNLLSDNILEKEGVTPANETLKWLALKQTRKLYHAEQLVTSLRTRLNQKEIIIDQLSQVNKNQTDLINSISSSRGWKLLQVLWKIRLWLIPHGSRQEKTVKSIRRFFNRDLARKNVRRGGIFTQRYIEQDNSSVAIYTTRKDFDSWSGRVIAIPRNVSQIIQTSLIAAVKNEGKNVNAWLKSVGAQTKRPTEIIVVDTGSTDETVEKLTAGAKNSPVPIQILSMPGANIAQARNKAIAEAQCHVVAVSDFGVTLSKDWLKNITYPFILNPETTVSAGIYNTIAKKNSHRSFRYSFWPSISTIDPQTYLPPGGSIAFTKEAWNRVGGYPEWLTMTGEDTFFDLELKKLGGYWAFVPDAVINWHAPKTGLQQIIKMYTWAVGDGESGVHALKYRRYFSGLIIGFTLTVLAMAFVAVLLFANIHLGWLWAAFTLVIFSLGVFLGIKKIGIKNGSVFKTTLAAAAQAAGFIKGASRQNEVQARRFAAIRGTIFVMAGMPIDDSGGGSRGAQFVNEFLNLGYAVVYIHKFPKYEKTNLHLPIIHPNLFHIILEDFSFNRFIKDYESLLSTGNIAGIVEFPLSEYLPVIKVIQNFGGKVIYDLMDDWQTSLGENWYVPKNEEDVIRDSDILTGSAESLCAYLKRISGKKAVLIPNAVNDRMFNPDRKFERPNDLPNHGRVITYVGALWGNWFDWDLLFHLARIQPADSFCVIGDYRHPRIDPPQNVHFLGLKPQAELPAYLACTDVAIIPWKRCKITESTSPLKLYEYLSMGCPVVAPDLPPLRNIPGVNLAKDQEKFVELVNQVHREDFDLSTVVKFLRKNNWQSRTRQLIDLLGFTS